MSPMMQRPDETCRRRRRKNQAQSLCGARMESEESGVRFGSRVRYFCLPVPRVSRSDGGRRYDYSLSLLCAQVLYAKPWWWLYYALEVLSISPNLIILSFGRERQVRQPRPPLLLVPPSRPCSLPQGLYTYQHVNKYQIEWKSVQSVEITCHKPLFPIRYLVSPIMEFNTFYANRRQNRINKVFRAAAATVHPRWMMNDYKIWVSKMTFVPFR